MKVDLPAELEAVVPGMFGRVLIPAERGRALLVPQSAIRRVGQLPLVRARGEGDAWQVRNVTTGRTVGDEVEVLTGLSAGEMVALFAPPRKASSQ